MASDVGGRAGHVALIQSILGGQECDREPIGPASLGGLLVACPAAPAGLMTCAPSPSTFLTSTLAGGFRNCCAQMNWILRSSCQARQRVSPSLVAFVHHSSVRRLLNSAPRQPQITQTVQTGQEMWGPPVAGLSRGQTALLRNWTRPPRRTCVAGSGISFKLLHRPEIQGPARRPPLIHA